MLYVNKITKTYKDITVLKNINMTFEDQGFYIIKGKSGIGKSTILNLILGLEKPDQGEIIYNGKDITKLSHQEKEDFRRNNIGCIFQNYNLIEYLTVRENLLIIKQDKEDEIENILESLGIKAYMNKNINELSGGERQRVAIARTIYQNSPIILADEPTSNLDVETAKEVIEILKSLSKSKLVIMVSHEDSQVINDADVIFKLNQHDEIIIEKRKISKPTNIFYDEIKHKNSFKNDFSITIKMLKNVLINKKAKHLSSIILLSLILFFTTIITIVIFSNYQYMYYTYAVEENNIYELVDINSNDLTYDRMALLENKFDDVYYYLRVFENITNTTTVTRLYINNDLQGYQTIISLNIADQLVLSQYQGALKRSDLYNTYISIFDVNLQIVNIDDQLISYQEDIYENQYIFISLDFYNQIISEIEIIYDLQINNEMFYDFEINASNELINNEIILPNEFVNINETASDITIILKNFNMNDQIDFQIKDINDLMHKEIWVSDEMYQYFVYQNVDGGIIKASLDWDSFNKLNNESIFINSSYLNYYISLENLIFNYQVLIIFIYMIFVILDLLIINSIYEQDIKENHSDFASLHLLGRSNIGKNRVLLYVLLMDGLSLLVNVSMFLIFSKQLDTLFRSYVFPIIMYHYVAFNLLVWCCGFIVSIMYVFLKIIKYQNIDMSKVY